MRLHFITFLAVGAARLIGVGADEKPNGSAHSLTAGRCQVSNKKHLRVHTPTDNDEEERNFPTTVAESIASALKPTFGPEHFERVEGWLADKKSAADVFKLLALDKAEDVLRHPDLPLLFSFVKHFNIANPKKQTSVITILTSHYGEIGTAKIIEAGKQVPDTARLARRLQKEQILRWMGQNKKPEDVLAILELDKAGSKLFEQPQVVAWVTYVDHFNKMYPAEAESVLVRLREQIQGEKTLVRTLIAAKEVSITKEVVVRVQAELTSDWLSTQMSPVIIFDFLKLGDVGVTLFDSPLFAAWMKYVHKYNLNPRDGKQVEVLRMLEPWYPEENLAKMRVDKKKFPIIVRDLKHNLHKSWFKRKLDPSDVSKLIESKGVAGDTLTKCTLYRAMQDYPEYIRRHRIDDNHAANARKRPFQDPQSLLKWFLAGNTETKAIAARTMEVMFKQWALNGVEPKTAYALLGSDESVAANRITKQVYAWYSRIYQKYNNAKRLKTEYSNR